MSTVDKYLLRLVALRFAAVVTIVSAIMSLENASRLALLVERTGTPFALLSRWMASLLPEYLAIALTNGEGAWDTALAAVACRLGRSARDGVPLTRRTARIRRVLRR